MVNTRNIDVFWVVEAGHKRSVHRCEAEAQESRKSYVACGTNEGSLTIEHTRETVPVVVGEIAEGYGEVVEVDEIGDAVLESSPQSYTAVHVFWRCPLCGESHNCSIRDSPPNPSLWFCELGEGIALVSW
jgi:hypothetical protein